MKIEFQHISIEGFMSIGKAEVELQDNGLVLVSGVNTNPNDNSASNGSGKSSIFEAIFYAATGYTIRGSKDIVNRNYPLGCKLELTIHRGNDIFKIVRSRNHHELGTKVCLFMNDEDISGKSMKDCDQVIKQYIPEISWNIVSSIIILGQGLPNKLTSYSPSGRKQLLEDLSQTSHFIEEVRSKLDARKYSVSGTLKEVEGELSRMSIESAALQRVIGDIRNKITYTIPEIDKDIFSAINELNSYIERQDLLKKEEEEVISDLLRFNKQKEEASGIYNKFYYDLQSLQSKVEKLKNNVCPTCGRLLDNSNELIAEKEACEKVIEQTRVQMNKQKSVVDEIEMSIANIVGARSKVSSERSQVDASVINLNSKLDRLDSLKKSVESAEEDIKRITSQLDENSKKSEELNPKKEALNESLTALGYLDRALSKEFKSYLLESVIDYLNKKISKYSATLFSEGYIKLVSSGNNLDIEVGEKSYESLSGGERQKADLCIQFALRDMLVNITGFNCNMLVLDEVFDNLDEIGCNNLLKLISNLFADIDSVYVITHHSDICIPKDKEFLVTKDFTGLSRLEVIEV